MSKEKANKIHLLNLFNTIKTYFIIICGLFINSFGWTAFLIPSGIIGGGVSGISTLIYYSTGISVGFFYFIINIFLILIGLKILGKTFGFKTIFGIFVISFFFSLLQSVFKKPIVSDLFMCSIIGGALAGIGIGIIFTQGGSTGGTDIIALIINKYRDISPGKIILLIDVLIIASSYLFFKSVEKLVYSYVTMFVLSYSIDLIIEGSKQSVQMFVFSNEHKKIADEIGNVLKRGVTILKGEGWYTKKEIMVLTIIVRKYQIQDVLRIIHKYDRQAFVSIASVVGVYGKGFESIKF
ncbi:MAG: YitT family protein [Spirochaetes bacterium]|nr:YitT family protein [Spirochaetota bacterium]